MWHMSTAIRMIVALCIWAVVFLASLDSQEHAWGASASIGDLQFCRPDDVTLLGWFDANITIVNRGSEPVRVLLNRERLRYARFGDTAQSVLTGEGVVSFGGHDYVSAVDALDPEGADIRTVQPNTSYDALLKIAVLVRVARDAPADTIGIGRHFVRIAVDL